MVKDIERDIVYTYEQHLLGNLKLTRNDFFERGQEKAEEIALIIIRFAVENLLKWSPQMMAEHFNGAVIKKMKLEKVVDKIAFPTELDQNKDYFYYAHLLYPNVVDYNDKKAIIKAFDNSLKEGGGKIKKGFLEGAQGTYRMKICLQHVLAKEGFTSIEEIYRTFAKPAGNTLLRKYKLEQPMRANFECALDYLHESLPIMQKDDNLYQYYKLGLEIKKAKKEVRRACVSA